MSKHEYPTSPQSAVGAVVIHDGRVLLVKRGKPPGKGLWAIPGGRIELGETLQEAAEREVKEEAGVIIQAKNPIYVFDVINRDQEGRIQFHYVIVDLMADYVSGNPHPQDDALDVRWFTAENLDHFNVSEVTRRLLKEQFDFG